MVDRGMHKLASGDWSMCVAQCASSLGSHVFCSFLIYYLASDVGIRLKRGQRIKRGEEEINHR